MIRSPLQWSYPMGLYSVLNGHPVLVVIQLALFVAIFLQWAFDAGREAP